MTGRAAFTDVDVSAGQFHRTVRRSAGIRCDQRLLHDARQHLHQPADGGYEQDAEDQQSGVLFQLSVQSDGVHRYDPVSGAGGETTTVRRPFMVMKRLYASSAAPVRKTMPATSRNA